MFLARHRFLPKRMANSDLSLPIWRENQLPPRHTPCGDEDGGRPSRCWRGRSAGSANTNAGDQSPRPEIPARMFGEVGTRDDPGGAGRHGLGTTGGSLPTSSEAVIVICAAEWQIILLTTDGAPVSGSIISILAYSFVFGLKHAVEPDHLAAVSSIVSERKSLLGSMIVGGWWGCGHTLSLLLAGVGVT
ncbi:MAG: hypothetical protein J2P52_17560, partial [Blastocatellia bacterium]|nr:hypothetical protein [Blastocatellia bacterium]